MELVILKRESAEWNSMWERLSQHPINVGLEDPIVALNNGEAWQYMGSNKQGDIVIHSFRHRVHPVTNKRENISFYASEDFTSDQIEKKIKLT